MSSGFTSCLAAAYFIEFSASKPLLNIIITVNTAFVVLTFLKKGKNPISCVMFFSFSNLKWLKFSEIKKPPLFPGMAFVIPPLICD
jgi:hypothetical protein